VRGGGGCNSGGAGFYEVNTTAAQASACQRVEVEEQY
jgi:hypothetical protein